MTATHSVVNMAGGFLAALFVAGVVLFYLARR